MNTVNAVIRRHWRLLVFILGLVFVFWLLWVLRSVFLPFLVGFILAYLLLPIIRWVEKRLPGAGKKQQLKRVSIIVVIYLLSLAVIGLIVFYIITVMGKSLLSMAQDAPQIIPNGLAAITKWLKSLPILSPPSIQQQIDMYSAQAGVAVGNALKDFLTSGWELVQSSSGMILGFAIMPIFTFFILKDWCRLRDRFNAALPPWTRTHTKNIFSILHNVVDAFFAIQDEILTIKEQYAEENQQAFDIPELKALQQQYNREELHKEPKISEVQRKKSEDLINASEYRYRRLFEAAREGILILDAETGQIVDVNPFLIEMLGYSKEEFLGKKLWEIGFFKDVAASKQSFTELQSKKYLRYEDLPLERKDGKLINVEFVSLVYDVDNKKVIQCNIRDITDRKIVEEALAQAAKRDSAVSILASKLVSSISISDISELVLESAERITGSISGFVGYIDLEAGYMISPAMIRGIWEASQSKDETTIFKKFGGLWGWVLNNRQSLLTNASADDPRFVENAPGRIPIHNFLSVPAMIGTELVGQVALANSNRNYNQQDLEFVERLATLYAITIKHQRTEDKIRKLAYHDPLTGLPNRALFNDRYIIALAGAKRYHQKIGLMVLDIDHFKNINDTLGHDAGDEVLKDFSGKLLSILRKTDTVMRSGGDEFVIMITDVVEPEYIANVAQKVLEATRKPFMFHDHEVRIATSIGISSYPEDGEDLEMLLKYADIAMYHIKEAGGDNYTRYVPGMETQVLE